MEAPLVTVICLCHNHERFVRESIESVLAQSHRNIQLIVVDDASTDRSSEIISEIVKHRPDITFLPLEKNLGNCAAFNKGYSLTKGDYLIDLAADDVLMSNRIEVGLQTLMSHGSAYGVHFSDAELIDEAGHHMGFHSDRFPHAAVPQGDIYAALIRRYFVCSPTMMFTSDVMEKLGGYDESLAYEDFDFWIRSSRDFKYCYSPEPLVKRRRVAGSLSVNQYQRQSAQMYSTFRVCEKIMLLNRDRREKQALRVRIRYEFKKALEFRSWRLALDYIQLMIRNGI